MTEQNLLLEELYVRMFDGRAEVPDWLPLNRHILSAASLHEATSYVWSITDIWSLILMNKPLNDIIKEDYITWLRDVVDASVMSGSAYPASITEGFMSDLMRDEFKDDTSRLLARGFSQAQGDARIALNNLAIACLGKGFPLEG